MTSREYMTIGEVVERLSNTYPGLSISKIRFLEEEGLVTPERTPGGYRKFTQADISRIELILRLRRRILILQQGRLADDTGRLQ